jgi:hypothetical protein
MFSANSAGFALIVVLALAFLALHLPYLPASLEDLDSINFALGIREFDVAHHQPHPPGYPIYIVLAKGVRALGASETIALALVSVVAGALGILAMGALFRRLDDNSRRSAWPIAAVAVAMTSPLYWFSAVRPLSDMAGLAAALAIQAMTLSATTERGLSAAALCAGLATGVRSQVAWLTVPLLVVKVLDARGWMPGARRATDGQGRPAPSIQHLATVALVDFSCGVFLWFAPLVMITGGPAAYWRALFDQGAEDFGNIQMLWTTHNVRALADALYYAFVAPWAAWHVAAIVLVCAALGLVWLYRHAPRAIIVLGAAFGPYLVFDLLFQETFTGRYALPLVVPIAYLAVSGLRLLPYETGLAAAVGIAMFDAHIGGTSIAAYAREKAPAFRLLDDMAAAARSAPAPPVLATDRRNAFDFRRPLVWAGDATPQIARALPAPPQHEWLEAVKYWNEGGRAPVWFVVDPMRTSIDLVQHGEPSRYRWPLSHPVLVSGARPNEMDWYRVDRPEWYVGEGWSLTPEAAGVAAADRRGLAHGPIDGWISRDARGGVLMVGGRNFDAAPSRLMVSTHGTTWSEIATVAPGPFLHFMPVPAADSGSTTGYDGIKIAAFRPAAIAIEQFDASAARPLLGFGEGWQEQEFNPRTGVRWRWLSERGELQVRSRSPRVVLHIEGESPLTYFSRPSRLVVRSGGHVVFDRPLAEDFALDVPIASAGEPIVLETDQAFSPADRSSRTADRRRLGLRIFKCELRASSQP